MQKEYKATQKYLLESPRKIRLVVDVVKKMKPSDAIEKLPFIGKRAAFDLAKVIKSAMASAKNAGVSETDLIFKEIQIGEGPRLKRGRAASRGMWHPYKKRMAHIRVVLATIKLETQNSKSETNSNEKKNEEKIEIKNKTKEIKKKGETSKKTK